MAKALFKYRNTNQEIWYTDAKQIASLKKNPKFTLLEETKPLIKKPNIPKEITNK
jgi:hypothetical protein